MPPDAFPSSRFEPRSRGRAVASALGLVVLAGCGGAHGTIQSDAGPPRSPVNWEAIRQVRPDPVTDAPTVTVPPFEGLLPEGMSVTLAELVMARFLHRRDLVMVDRRRYAAAVERLRRGLPADPSAPEPGLSPGADWILEAAASPTPGDDVTLTVRLTESATGRIAATRAVTSPSKSGWLGAAREAGDLLLDMLREAGRLPVDGQETAPWALAGPVDSPEEAVRLFAEGVGAEDRWAWEEAGSAYEAAGQAGGAGFTEAAQALARVSRLRAGGTLGRS